MDEQKEDNVAPAPAPDAEPPAPEAEPLAPDPPVVEPEPPAPFTIVEFSSLRLGRKKSWVWEHCGFPKENGKVDREKTACKICWRKSNKITKMPYRGNTTSMSHHLHSYHGDVIASTSGSSGPSKQGKGMLFLFANVEYKIIT